MARTRTRTPVAQRQRLALHCIVVLPTVDSNTNSNTPTDRMSRSLPFHQTSSRQTRRTSCKSGLFLAITILMAWVSCSQAAANTSPIIHHRERIMIQTPIAKHSSKAPSTTTTTTTTKTTAITMIASEARTTIRTHRRHLDYNNPNADDELDYDEMDIVTAIESLYSTPFAEWDGHQMLMFIMLVIVVSFFACACCCMCIMPRLCSSYPTFTCFEKCFLCFCCFEWCCADADADADTTNMNSHTRKRQQTQSHYVPSATDEAYQAMAADDWA